MDDKNPDFTLVLNLNEVNAIFAAIQELPAKIANPIADKIKTQAQEQIDKLQANAASQVAQ
jgi:hypothetical protein